MKTEKKHVHLAKVASVAALVLTTSSVFAAIIPPGVVLADKQEFVRSNGSEPETLDPMLSESVPASQIVHDLFEGLTATNNEGVLQPGLATSWQQTSDTTWVFQLRKNAKWSDGTGITAHDVVYGIQRLVDPAIAARYAGAFGGFFLNGAEIVAGEKPHTDIGVKALDDYTLEIETAFPVPFLPELLANSQMGPAPRAAIEKHGKDWTKPGNMVSNGPFSLKDWRVNSKVVVEKNPHYWNAENVQLTQVTFLPIEDQNADLKLFQSGQTDMTASLPPGVYSALQKSHPNELKNSSNLGLRYYSLNHRDPLFQDVRVRQALSMVIDRDVMAEKITANGQKPTYSVILEGLHGAKPTPYAWQSWPMKERVAYAQKLLKDAGVKPGTKLKISYNTSDDHKKMALFMASEWKQKLGVHVAMARVVRGQTLSIKSREFVEAARSIGVSQVRIIARHIVPNLLGIVVIYTTITVPGVILTESVLSFLGLGVQEPMTSWGVLIGDGAKVMEHQPWMLLFPAAMLSTTLYCVNYIGDGLRDALDPKDR